MDDAPGEPVSIGASGVILRDRSPIMALLLARRTPVTAPYLQFVEEGALLSYSVDDIALWRDIADYVDRVAKGAKTAELPISQPTRFKLLINLKIAKANGLTMPQSLLARADEVIE